MKTDNQKQAEAEALWRAGAHYKKLAEAHADAGSKLACLVLSANCVGDYGGPSEEMVALAELILGEQFDKVVDGLVTPPST
jgi:hypothetical protein